MREAEKDRIIKEEHVLNEDLENYFANTIIPQLFVDANLILRKFTPPAMKQFTLTSDDINKDIRGVIGNIRYPTLIENINEVMETGEILEKEIQTTDRRWYQMNILPYIIRKENSTNGVIITFVDITKRLSTLKELEKLNSQYDILMYALSHDIRQPLSTVYIVADQLLDAFDRGDRDGFMKLTESLTRSSKNMNTLLEDFTKSLPSTNKISDEEEERINIEPICHDVILALREEIHDKEVDICTEFNTSEILFSRKNLRSILFNLLSNALKFRDPQKPLKILIKTERKENVVLLKVEDNGLGIDKKYHKEIFNKSTRLEKSVKGTGMGLYILNRMLVDKGGKIEVESTPGKGSAFLVYFKTRD